MKNIFLKTVTLLSIIGAIMVSLGFPLYANIVWSISNPLMAWHNYRIAQKEQAVLFGVFTGIAWFGVIHLWQ